MTSLYSMDLQRRLLIEIASDRMENFDKLPDQQREARRAELKRLDALITEASDWIDRELKATR
jgi:hypothetical protein